jgi:pimeloyl-ACP methyl ester carboxylesterase
MSGSSQWRLLAEQLARDYRVIAVDLCGYGPNPMPSTQQSFELKHEVAHVLDALDGMLPPDTDFHLVGHSYGGAVALKLARSWPSRVRSLLLYEPTAFHLLPKLHPALAPVNELAAIVEESARPNVDPAALLICTEAIVDFWRGPGTFSSMSEHQRASMVKLLPKVSLDFQALFNEPLVADDYRELGIQTCVIAGSSSPNCVHQIAAVLADVLPMRELRWVPAGHMAPVTHPQLVNPMIEAFTKAVDLLREPFWPNADVGSPSRSWAARSRAIRHAHSMG